MKKKYWFILLIIIIIIGGIFFYKNSVKNYKSGNNKNSQEIVNYILNISSYEVKVTVDVSSNKNSNKYILKQTYQKPNQSMQEVLEPSNIAGVKIENDGTNLKIENSQLSLNNILENYSYLGDNCLDLYSFIEDYKQDEKATYEEKDNEIAALQQQLKKQNLPILLGVHRNDDLLKIAIEVRNKYWADYPENVKSNVQIRDYIIRDYGVAKTTAEEIEKIACPIDRKKN